MQQLHGASARHEHRLRECDSRMHDQMSVCCWHLLLLFLLAGGL
jgi:hypothetical protein